MLRAPQPVPGAVPRLRILSCNILAGARIDRYRHYVTRSLHQVLPWADKKTHLDALARTIGQFDIIGLQEADAGSLRSGFLNQTRYLAEAAHMPWWSFQPNRRVARVAASANGLISRLEPAAVYDHPLPGRIPGRGVLVAHFGVAGRQLTVLVAHLSLGAQARAHQLGFISELLQDFPDAVLMGDFNCELDNGALHQLLPGTHLCLPEQRVPTFPSWQPTRAIDHILATEKLALQRAWALPASASDHLPLAAEVALPPRLAYLAGGAERDAVR